MQYRKFGSLDWEVSALGFGAMRLPVKGEEQKDIDEPAAIEMIRYAIDNGVNYIDTAFFYHAGASEVLVGKAVKDGYREKVKIATKLPVMMAKTLEDCDKTLKTQLEKLDIEYIDFYLLHGLNKMGWKKVSELGITQWLEQQRKDGKIRHIGFSFHDDFDCFKEIIDGYDGWEFCQIQYNYMDTEIQAGEKGLKYAAEKNIAVIVMEPLRGGLLATTPPASVKKIWDTIKTDRTYADWALQWIWNQPEVTMVLSGMSTLSQVRENIELAGKSSIGSVTQDEIEFIAGIRDEYMKTTPIPCTDCKYCQPCQVEINIPGIFSLYIDGKRYENWDRPRMVYNRFFVGKGADNCIECRECEEQCPQAIEIVDWLKICHEELYDPTQQPPPPPPKKGD